jgi:hypothetical protein
MSNDIEKERLATLAQELASATGQRAADWERKDDDLYSWGATEGTVTIASRDSDGEPPYQLTVYTSAGEKVDELASELIGDDQPAPWNEALAELYHVARRSALRADDIIDSLIQRLRVAGGDDAGGVHRSRFRRAGVGVSGEST